MLSSRQVRLQKITVLSWPCSIFERWMGKLDSRSAKSSPKWRIQGAPNHLAWAEFPPGHVHDSAPLLKIHEKVEGVREKQTWPVRPETSLIMLIGTTGLGLVRVLSPHAGHKSPAPCASPSFLHQTGGSTSQGKHCANYRSGPPRRLRPLELIPPWAAVKIRLALRPLDPGQLLWSNGTTKRSDGVLFEPAGGAFKQNGKESGGKSGHFVFRTSDYCPYRGMNGFPQFYERHPASCLDDVADPRHEVSKQMIAAPGLETG